jgi:hypothetical protein
MVPQCCSTTTSILVLITLRKPIPGAAAPSFLAPSPSLLRRSRPGGAGGAGLAGLQGCVPTGQPCHVTCADVGVCRHEHIRVYTCVDGCVYARACVLSPCVYVAMYVYAVCKCLCARMREKCMLYTHMHVPVCTYMYVCS